MENIDLKGLEEDRSDLLPPVHSWTPPFCGDMDLVIKANGEWFHEGVKISRQSMIRMFSRILWLECGEYFLVTPVEKVRIQVEDAPFLMTKWDWIETAQGRAIELTSKSDDVMTLGVNCDIWMDDYDGEERPYISMRYGMKALVSRAVFYDIVQHLEQVDVEGSLGVGIISAGKSYLFLKDV